MRAYTNCREVAPIGGQHSIDFPPLSKGGYRAVDQTQFELLELGVEFERAYKIGRQRQLVLVAGRWIEDLGDQLAMAARLSLRK